MTRVYESCRKHIYIRSFNSSTTDVSLSLLVELSGATHTCNEGVKIALFYMYWTAMCIILYLQQE